ncbi:CusA/CzcA family heavy metal efflux RND transporter [Saprospira grandis]|nr:CusA/CzcA family heavy metal efflux RND transporter [Saprospira grandis]
MLDKIILWSIKNKLMMGLGVLALLLVGIYNLRSLSIDALPDITNNQLQLITNAPELSTQEMEQLVTFPLEQSVKSIPHLLELRSISRFGISVVTLVFDESVDPYWARAQVNERTGQVELPPGVERPSLGPVSTGLGEIYQYSLSAKAGFEEQFSAMQLRSIQDWVIKPQVLGIPGVAELNTLGGELKQYEVVVYPERLRPLGLSLLDVMSALENNHENTGAAYIDHKPYAHFIRAVGKIQRLEELGQIHLGQTEEGRVILLKEVADFKFGSPMRYGAATKDGKGEVVVGIVMMLKGANSAKVIEEVRNRMESIKAKLPEGVELTTFLDRSRLVNKASSTIASNLIEGALIVLFVLLLLIGNLRAGLIVASVIPLSLLFAISLMNFFGVSGNLMSLGAIDFGLIVDGSVIIVEAAIHFLHQQQKKRLTAEEMDQAVYESASKIRSTAAFGEIIILIVYLPILVLSGVEGKMFVPMAQTVAFAILGAFILSLTYVPMMMALFLSKNIPQKANFSDRLVAALERAYSPVLALVMRAKAPILGLAILALGFSGWIFSQMGGEFIPTLGEGDLAAQFILPEGSSLDQEIEVCGKAEKLLLDNFPEVLQVVSKIGSAEVPTDPMPMQVADGMVILKDREDWVSATNREELVEKMQAVLEQIPELTTEFSQPIQMRFNELMTGVRADVAIKIFGEDLATLSQLGEEVQKKLASVEGTEDVRVEAVSGLAQIRIEYIRERLAYYQLDVSRLNRILEAAFAGSSLGQIQEGQRRFDLVVRLAAKDRQDINALKALQLPLPSGEQIQLGDLAKIDFVEGPAQISREEGQRRIVISFNVRGRDVQSVVEEIQAKVEPQLQMPASYYLSYGGQFKNLEDASQRLLVVVPLALFLIFLLLYFTFHSMGQALLIFTAIPFSAIGGIWALWLRDMPFSISAAVGFIALFGVAVLNGIVLIAHFNELKKNPDLSLEERILQACRLRLRPVLMTASVAALGFLPMALSQAAGAEVQKPLASVVIGGLLTATLLTLFVLPILYYYSQRLSFNKAPKSVLMIGLLILASTSLQAQEAKSYAALRALGQENWSPIQAKQSELAAAQARQGGARNWSPTNFQLGWGQINTPENDWSFGIEQELPSLLAWRLEAQAREQKGKSAQIAVQLEQQSWAYELQQLLAQRAYYLELAQLYQKNMTLLEQQMQLLQKQVELGEISPLKVLSLERLLWQWSEQNRQLQLAQQQLEQSLLFLLGLDELPEMEVPTWQSRLLEIQDSSLLAQQPELLLAQIAQQAAQLKQKQEKASYRPRLSLNYQIQSMREEARNQQLQALGLPRYQQIGLGLNAPILGRKNRKKELAALELEAQALGQRANQKAAALGQEYLRLKRTVDFYQQTLSNWESRAAQPQAEYLQKMKRAFELGEIEQLAYLQALQQYLELEQQRATYVWELHKAMDRLDYLLGRFLPEGN